MASFFSTLFGGGAEAEAADKNRALYNQYQGQGTGYLDSGLGKSSGYLNSALGAYSPLANLAGDYRKGSGLYLDALGVNGADAAKTAQGQYTSSPGYQFAMDQGLQALARQHASAGNLNSGNADIDTLKFSQGLASQDYGSWLDRLSGVNNNALQATTGAATGQAGAYGSLSDLYSQDAQNRIGLLGNTTSGLASSNNLQAAGQAAGAKNLLGAGLALASLPMAGGGSLFGAFGSSLGSAAGGLSNMFSSGSKVLPFGQFGYSA